MRTIQAYLSGYFIKQAYEKLRTNRLEKFRQLYKNSKTFFVKENWDKDEYIEIRDIGNTKFIKLRKKNFLQLKKAKWIILNHQN